MNGRLVHAEDQRSAPAQARLKEEEQRQALQDSNAVPGSTQVAEGQIEAVVLRKQE